MIWVDIDPFRFLSQILTFQGSHFITIPLRTCILTWVGVELIKSFCGLATVALIILAASSQILARCSKVLNTWTNSQTRVMKVYKELQIWNCYCNHNFCYFAVPPLIFFGMSIIIFATYLTIRIPGKIPLALYLLLPTTSVIGFVVVVTILPQGTMVYEKSVSFLGFLRGTCFSRYEMRIFRSLNNVGIMVGPFGMLTKSLMLAIVWNIVYYTINLLLTF